MFVQFGVQLAPSIPVGAEYPVPGSAAYRAEERSVRVDFELAVFASAKPHRDDEDLGTVTGYDLVPRRGWAGAKAGFPGLASALQGVASLLKGMELEDREWVGTGSCPDPRLYYSVESAWLDEEWNSWATRQRTSHVPNDAVHFLLDGRYGYVKVLALGFSWRARPCGSPLLSDVSGDPVMTGRWIDGGSTPGEEHCHPAS